MAISCNLGFPRIGIRRQLKTALERYWAGQSSAEELFQHAAEIRRQHWQMQRDAGIEHIPSNDFSLYDHVLDTAAMVGCVPARFAWTGRQVEIDTYFAMARGSNGAAPLEMTKWFDTNYHYLVPEFEPGMTFKVASSQAVEHFVEALKLGITTRPVLLGPISFLCLGKSKAAGFRAMSLLPGLLPVYRQVISELAAVGAKWIQIDEPILVTDLPGDVLDELPTAYEQLAAAAPNAQLCLTTYFGALGDYLPHVLRLPVAAVHLDLVRAPRQLQAALELVPDRMMLSLGVVDGRNIWRTDLERALAMVEAAVNRMGKDRVLIGPSCSLLHCPIDLDEETHLDAEMRSWLAFAKQKLGEVAALTEAVNRGRQAAAAAIAASSAAMASRARSQRIHNPAVKQRLAALTPEMFCRPSPDHIRRQKQREKLKLPLLPTTTIGSFPQTSEIRKARAALKNGSWTQQQYEQFCREQIAAVVRIQEELGLDVLVHGEPERNDMVEYFGEQLEGFVFTRNGWVQSYGSRCVKPPVIFGDVCRRRPMTVAWSTYAQSLTAKPMKGMLTGPITILQWSFVRDDIPRRETAFQIALAIRDEVADLERAGIDVIQIDEPALREGLPLRQAERGEYLRWAVDAFRLASAVASDQTQIHTHMCYGEFADIIQSIAELDADVISIEAARSDMELLDAFSRHAYPRDIGPGVYDIHSPLVPSTEQIIARLRKALRCLKAEQLWVNPDCGLKTRGWPETRAALQNMVAAARALRHELGAVS